MVGDVAEEVGGVAGPADEDAVLVVTVPCRRQPAGPLVVVQELLAVEVRERLADLAAEAAVLAVARVQRALRRPDVERHAQACERQAELRKDRVAAPDLDRVDHVHGECGDVGGGRLQRAAVAVAGLGDELVGEHEHVVALIALLRDRRVEAESLPVAGGERLAEARHLRAVVVHVELTRDVVPHEREDAAQRVAVGRVARVAHVQRPCGVHAHELDVHLEALRLRQRAATVVCALLEEAAQSAPAKWSSPRQARTASLPQKRKATAAGKAQR